MKKIIDVVAAVIMRPDGSFLLARRPEGKPYAGYWEFPGGKVEAGEALRHALARELHEELGITVTRAHPWLVRHFDYAHASVKLHFFRVVEWQDEPHGREGQLLAWQTPGKVDVSPLLPANGPILSALELTGVFAITDMAKMGKADFMDRLDRALGRGLRLIQFREKAFAADELEALVQQIVARVRPHGARLVINSGLPPDLAALADGVHLNAGDLMGLAERPTLGLCGASCHNAAELAHAAGLGLDYVVLSPVLPTLSHPGEPALEWEGFAALIRDYPLPVYALGGMAPELLEVAQENGAHGIAMLRAAWV